MHTSKDSMWREILKNLVKRSGTKQALRVKCSKCKASFLRGFWRLLALWHDIFQKVDEPNGFARGDAHTLVAREPLLAGLFLSTTLSI